jgi:MscS family membrane protein
LRTGLQIIILAILLVIIIGEWGYDVSGLIAGLGLGGLAVSLAAQDTIANVFGFSAIVADRPFVVGEVIKTPDVEGTVEHVGLRSTRVRQPDQALVTLPNSKLVSSAILNWSRLSKRWLNLTLRIDYNANSQQIQSLIERLRTTLAEREHVETDSVVVFFTNFGDQALEVLVRCYIMLPDWTDFSREKEAINLEIMRIIEELDLSIALPNRTVFIENRSTLSNDSHQS